MGQDPEVIRHQIEQTRENMGETVDALGFAASRFLKASSRQRYSTAQRTASPSIGNGSGAGPPPRSPQPPALPASPAPIPAAPPVVGGAPPAGGGVGGR